MTKRITEAECNELYEQYSTPVHVIKHCRAVSHTAVAIGRALNSHGYSLDLDLIKGAGLVHDLARVSENHEKVGADILASRGYGDEADIVCAHMRYDFDISHEINEADLVCLSDRLVKEDRYVGLEDRIQYIIHKAGDIPEHTERILRKKEETRAFMDKIETQIGQTIDSLFMKG